jgi:AAA domain
MTKLKAIEPKKAEPRKPKVMIYGKPGVGKTFTSLDFPNCYFIDTEGGATRDHYTDKLKKSGGAYLGREQGSDDFNTVIEQVEALATEKHAYKTLVIDSFTKLYNIATFEAAQKGGDDFGRDKKEANKPTRRLMNWLDRIDMNVILIAHEKPLWGIDAKGQRAEIGTTFDGYDKIEYDIDLILNIQKSGPIRNARVTKSRLIAFPEGQSFPWAYEEFASRYGKDVIEDDVKAITLASEEQVNSIVDYIKLYKIEDEKVEKWIKAAKATKLEELTEANAKAMIEHIEKTYKGDKK